MIGPSSGSKSRLFLSYSRRDSAFADELVVSLESYEFEVVFDREDLFPGEPWEPRLRALISDADTTVCVVSSQWVASEQCKKEFMLALDQGRRIIPAVIDPVNPADMPAELARLQFVFFHGEGHSYARGVVALLTALRTDIAWVREQSRLVEKAEEWIAGARSKALLLRGTTLERALEWIGRPAPAQTRIAPIVTEYVEASRRGQDDDEKSKLRDRVRFAAFGFVAAVVALVVTAGAGYALVSSQGETIAQQTIVIDAGRDLASYDEDEPRDVTTPSNEPGQPSTEEQGESDDGPSAEPPGPSQPEEPVVTAASIAAELDSADRITRVQAGQRAAERVLARDNAEMVNALVAELQGDRLEALSANGRFNVLYVLNTWDAWADAPQAGALTAALETIEQRANNPARLLPIGWQTQDCIDRLQRKLSGERGVGDSCGRLSKR